MIVFQVEEKELVKMFLELSSKQKLITYLVMSFVSLVIYSFFLVGKSVTIQTIYLGIISIIFSGDRPSVLYAVVRSFPRDMK